MPQCPSCGQDHKSPYPYSADVLFFYKKIREEENPETRALLMDDLVQTFIGEFDQTDISTFSEGIHERVASIVEAQDKVNNQVLGLGRLIVDNISRIEKHVKAFEEVAAALASPDPAGSSEPSSVN